MKRLVGFGEVLLRLSAPGHQQIDQARAFETHVAGCENNVVCAASRWGTPGRMVSVIPPNALGDGVVREIRSHGVCSDHLLRCGDRLGLYFHEHGAGARGGSLVYDRARSAFAETPGDAYRWAEILADAGWLHLSGITPALSSHAADSAAEAARQASARDLPVSLDLNYRSTLWKPGDDPAGLIRPLAEAATLMVVDPNSASKFFGIESRPWTTGEAIPVEQARELAARCFSEFAELRSVIVSRRAVRSATDQAFGAMLISREQEAVSPLHPIAPVIDRLGAGDALVAGVIHRLILQPDDLEAAIRFGAAAGAIQHAVVGDICLASEAEIAALAETGVAAGLKR